MDCLLLLLILLVMVFGEWSDHGKKRLEVQQEILDVLLRVEKAIRSGKDGGK